MDMPEAEQNQRLGANSGSWNLLCFQRLSVSMHQRPVHALNRMLEFGRPNHVRIG
jgi:hypothetical protein